MLNKIGYKAQSKELLQTLYNMSICDLEYIQYIEVSRAFMQDMKETKEFDYLTFKPVKNTGYLHLKVVYEW